MAAFNSTKTAELAGSSLHQHAGFMASQREKISCWFGKEASIDPMEVLGLHIRYAVTFLEPEFSDQLFEEDGLSRTILEAGKVLAVQIPAPGSGEKTYLLILVDGFSEPDYFDLNGFTLLEARQ